MKGLSIFLYEGKHFARSPFKVVALVLFILAAGYGLHNGASLYHEQVAEVEKIYRKIQEDRQPYLDYYKEGKVGPENRPWVNIEEPFWAIWLNSIYHMKAPSAAMVYSIGQAEQYGYYKRVTTYASPYDSDMTQEIANPERLQTGTLDFTFALLFLLPLLLLILVYNLKSMEAEQGFLPLIEVQTATKHGWLLSRVSFYVVLLYAVIIALLVYGALLTGVWGSASSAFGQMLLFAGLYLVFWSVVYYLILRSGSSIIGNTLKMVGIWIVVAFIIPAGVQQWISIEKPANLMTDFIDAQRDQTDEVYALSDSAKRESLETLFPEILDSRLADDDPEGAQLALEESTVALVNEVLKSSITEIEADNEIKNTWVRTSYLVNPVAFFHNRFNRISQTHYDDYQTYRREIQELVDKQIRTLVLDYWAGVTVDEERFEEYYQTLSTL